MVRPKKLYRWESRSCYEHAIGPRCMPQIAGQYPWGTLLRCRHEHGGGDWYGYAQKKAAKTEKIQSLKEEIAEMSALLDKLTKGTEL